MRRWTSIAIFSPYCWPSPANRLEKAGAVVDSFDGDFEFVYSGGLLINDFGLVLEFFLDGVEFSEDRLEAIFETGKFLVLHCDSPDCPARSWPHSLHR